MCGPLLKRVETITSVRFHINHITREPGTPECAFVTHSQPCCRYAVLGYLTETSVTQHATGEWLNGHTETSEYLVTDVPHPCHMPRSGSLRFKRSRVNRVGPGGSKGGAGWGGGQLSSQHSATTATQACTHRQCGVFNGRPLRYDMYSYQFNRQGNQHYSADRGHDNSATHQEVGILRLTVVMTTVQHTRK